MESGFTHPRFAYITVTFTAVEMPDAGSCLDVCMIWHEQWQTIVLKPKVSSLEGEIIDRFHEQKALCEFYEKQIEDAKETGVMFSLHVKLP